MQLQTNQGKPCLRLQPSSGSVRRYAKAAARCSSSSSTDATIPSIKVTKLSTEGGQKGSPLVRTGPHLAQLPLPDSTAAWPLIGDTLGWLEWGRGGDWYKIRKQQYGDVFKANILLNNVVLINGEDAIREVLALEHKVVEFGGLPTFKELLGQNSLLVQQQTGHTRMRRAFSQGFTLEAMRTYVPTVVEVVYSYVDSWLLRDQVPAAREGKDMALDVAGAVLMGWKFEREELQELRARFTDFSNGFVSLPLDLPFTPFGKAMAARKFLTEKIDSYISKAMLAQEESGGSSVKSRANTLDVMLRVKDDHGQPLTRSEIQDQALTSLFAGHETTATSISFVIVELYRNPEVLRRLRQEHAQLIRTYGSDISADVLDNMPYTDAVCKEIIRLKPPIPFLWRRTLEDVEVMGKRIPKGWALLLLIEQTLQQVPEWVATKEEFNPARWLESSSPVGGTDSPATDPPLLRKDPRGYMPFGDGPRLCLGMRLAYMELKVVLTALARRTVFDVVDPLEKWEPFEGWTNGLQVAFRPMSEEQLLSEH